MPLKLMYITNRADIAVVAEQSGVDWIFIDLEINGKKERQGHLDTVISHHEMEDIGKVKEVLTKAELLVRVNPIYDGSKKEIDRAIASGADIVMLPYFKSKVEVEEFLSLVNQKARTCLLLETVEAAENIDTILDCNGIDFIHIGLNDLHLGYKKQFMFELLAEGTVERLCRKIRGRQIPCGFGGIAQIGQGSLPAENIIPEHYRFGSSMAILSRSFCDVRTIKDIGDIEEMFQRGVKEIRKYEEKLETASKEFFEANNKMVIQKVNMLINE